MAKKKKKSKSKPKKVTVTPKKGIGNFCFGKYGFTKGKKTKIPVSIYKKNKSRVKEVKNG